MGVVPAYTEKFFRAACLRVLGPDGPDPDRINRIITAMALRAENGDVSASTFLRDTWDGKPSQEITGANGGPISLQFSINYQASDDAKTIEHEPLTGLQPALEGQGGPESGG